MIPDIIQSFEQKNVTVYNRCNFLCIKKFDPWIKILSESWSLESCFIFSPIPQNFCLSMKILFSFLSVCLWKTIKILPSFFVVCKYKQSYGALMTHMSFDVYKNMSKLLCKIILHFSSSGNILAAVFFFLSLPFQQAKLGFSIYWKGNFYNLFLFFIFFFLHFHFDW